jgi:flagellar biosynthesis protein FlhA
VRRRLGIYFVPEFESRPGIIKALTLDPRLEQLLTSKVHRTSTDVGLSLEPVVGRHLLDEFSRRTTELAQAGSATVLVVSADARLPLKRFFEPSFPRLVVLSFQELPASCEIENAGIVPMLMNYVRTDVVPIKAAA